jgi:hypothetical protein
VFRAKHLYNNFSNVSRETIRQFGNKIYIGSAIKIYCRIILPNPIAESIAELLLHNLIAELIALLLLTNHLLPNPIAELIAEPLILPNLLPNYIKMFRAKHFVNNFSDVSR